MRPRNIAVYLVAVVHAVNVGPEVAAALGQHESISSRAAAVDSQVSDTHFVHPSELRLLRGEASVFEQVRAGAGSPIELKISDPDIVKFIEGRLRLNGDVDIGRILRAQAKPIDFVQAVGFPTNALKDRIENMTFLEKMILFFKLHSNRKNKKRLQLLRKFEDAYKERVTKLKINGRSRGPVL